VATAEKWWHEAIVYPAVVVKGTAKPQAASKFIEYLRGSKAQGMLRARGFAAPQEDERAGAAER
jgi:ABC-type molybdate transport system substrate-binding protein